MAAFAPVPASRYTLTRPPRDDDELYDLVQTLWGITIPRHKVCPDHSAPFTWFADSFFARAPQTLVHGSRGLSGKSYAMAALGLTNAVVWGADVNLLGGSLAQSMNLHEHMRSYWDYDGSPRYMLLDESNIRVKLSNKARIRPLTASQKTVRGPHPARLLLDEIDEMDYAILQGALGQPMPQKNWMGVEIPAQTAMASTWQNADGTFSAEYRRFKEENLPIYTWCVSGGAITITADGEKKIRDVTPDDLVLTRQGYKKVQHVTMMGIKPTVELRTDDGRSLELTGDHKVLTSDRGWVAAESLRPGDGVRVLQARAAVSADCDSVTVHVVSVTAGAVMPVYDIGVEDAHEFTANGIVVHNCYRDSANPIDGWLSEEFIEQKKREIPREMWRVEYELGEPSIGNRAFDTESVERMFYRDVVDGEQTVRQRDYEVFHFEDYDRTQDYVVAADWAKSQDFTVIGVWKVTELPMTLVHYVRVNRRPYPFMVGLYNDLRRAYQAEGIHDATGLGGTIADYLDGKAWHFVMAGRNRDDMLSEYVSAVENNRVRAPRIQTLYTATKYCTVEELYSRGQEYHLPDEVCMSALAWKAVSGRFPAVEPYGSPKTENNWMARQVEHNTQQIMPGSPWRIDAAVRIKSEDTVWNLTG